MKKEVVTVVFLLFCSLFASGQKIYEISKQNMQNSGSTAGPASVVVPQLSSGAQSAAISFGTQSFVPITLSPIGATNISSDDPSRTVTVRRLSDLGDDSGWGEANENPGDPNDKDKESPIGSAWIMLLFAAFYVLLVPGRKTLFRLLFER